MSIYALRNRNRIGVVEDSAGIFGDVDYLNLGASLYTFSSFTFTSPIKGYAGPTLTEVLAGYNTSTYSWLTNITYFNMTTQGIQRWTAPVSGTYRFTLKGAAGGQLDASTYNPRWPGDGATIITDIVLTKNSIYNIIVGQTPNNAANTYNGSPGGGATWVVDDSGVLLACAGGGGGWGHGSSTTTGGIGLGGSATNYPTSVAAGATVVAAADGVSYTTNGTGQSNGLALGGGLSTTGTSGGAGGGTGWNGPGSSDTGSNPAGGGTRYTGGTSGRGVSMYGGFGGGGGSNGTGCAGGGGGGYSGGAAGNNWSGATWGSAGGGGSYWTGTLVSATAGANGIATANVANGYVTVTRL